MAVLSAVGAQELPPRRRVEVELLDGHRGSRRERGRLRHPDLTAVDLDAPRVRLVLRTRSEAQPRHGGNRGESFAAKAERRDRLEVGRGRDLGCRVPRERQREILALDAGAVVGNADELDAAAGQIDVDRARAGVEAVLQQLLQRRRGPLDHLAGGDLVDQMIRKRTNRRHQRTSPFAQCV